MNDEMNAAITAVLKAGRAIMEIYAREFSVEEKEDRSPLTEADTRAHGIIETVLREATPEIPILSEEGAGVAVSQRQTWDRYWLVDPLDGTKEFIKKNDEFTVNIALMTAAPVSTEFNTVATEAPVRPTAGVVYVPATGVLYVGVEGQGAWRVREGSAFSTPGAGTIRLSDVMKHGEALPAVLDYADRPFTVVASRSHLSPETEAYVSGLRRDHSDLEMVSAGSSLKICRVAEGSADEYPRFAPTMEWDTAAGDAVARAAGCQVLQWDPTARNGQGAVAGDMVYNKDNLLNPWFLVRRR